MVTIKSEIDVGDGISTCRDARGGRGWEAKKIPNFNQLFLFNHTSN
jgi:hypothetical protein